MDTSVAENMLNYNAFEDILEERLEEEEDDDN